MLFRSRIGAGGGPGLYLVQRRRIRRQRRAGRERQHQQGRANGTKARPVAMINGCRTGVPGTGKRKNHVRSDAKLGLFRQAVLGRIATEVRWATGRCRFVELEEKTPPAINDCYTLPSLFRQL